MIVNIGSNSNQCTCDAAVDSQARDHKSDAYRRTPRDVDDQQRCLIHVKNNGDGKSEFLIRAAPVRFRLTQGEYCQLILEKIRVPILWYE